MVNYVHIVAREALFGLTYNRVVETHGRPFCFKQCEFEMVNQNAIGIVKNIIEWMKKYFKESVYQRLKIENQADGSIGLENVQF